MPCDTSEDMAAAFSSEEQRMYIKFEYYRKKNARKILVVLLEFCGNCRFLFTSCHMG